MDGRYITEARTAAVSAVSTRYLARPDASTLAIIGSGVQARSHLEAYQHVRQLKEVRVWSPKPHSRERSSRTWPATCRRRSCAADSAEDAVRGADMIVLATSSPTPVIEDAWVADGRARRVRRRLPPDSAGDAAGAGRARRLYVDSRAAAIVESGDVVMSIADGLFDASHIRGELGELVLGRVAGRTSDRGDHGVQVARHGGRRRRRRRSRVSPRLGIRRRNGADVMTDERHRQPKKRTMDPDRPRRAVAVRRPGVGAIVVCGVVVPSEHGRSRDISEDAREKQFDAVARSFPGQQPLIQLRRRPPSIRRRTRDQSGNASRSARFM